MAVYSAREIYRFAVMAGFTPDQAVTMTAIALAESGGDSGAHNPRGEDSRGLWQVNLNAHRGLAARDLSDPLENARAAFEVSRGGTDVSPWTSTHGVGEASYLSFRTEALTAARSSGAAGVMGNFSGTPGYGHPLPAGGGAGFAQAGYGGGAETFVQAALAQTGDEYAFGAPSTIGDADPEVFDCSELTRWAAHQAGVDLPDGSYAQYLQLEQSGMEMSVDEALRTRGALLFSFSSEPTPGGGRPDRAHVAISLGDGRTIEARGSSYGVGSFSGEGRFNYAAAVPGLAPAVGVPDPSAMLEPPVPTAVGPAVDSDRDGLIDALEADLGTAAGRADTDADGVSDGYEIARLRTDPTSGDTDRDQVPDSVEQALGTDPTNADTDRDGRLDGATDFVDHDSDGISDPLEALLGTNPRSLDSDRDGFSDMIEYQAGSDPTDAMSDPLRLTWSGTTSAAGSAILGPGALGTEFADPADPSPDDLTPPT
jgi:cell wall-associated NlpC family hydrolase